MTTIAGKTTTPAGLPAETEQELIALWPSLPYEARNLYLKILDALLPEDAPILDVLEELEDEMAFDAAVAEGGEIIPLAQVRADIQQRRP
jgi:hypothetical protein